MHWRSRLVAVGCVLGMVAGLGPVPAGADPRSTVAPRGAGLVAHTVTLVTGDIVHLERQPDGRQAATVQPGPGRERIDFHQREVDGRLHVFPADVVPGLSDKRLDPALFDVTGLIEQGYTDEQDATLPLILTYGDLRVAAAPAAAELGVTLSSVDARAVRADKSRATEFWQSTVDTGVERISLDRKVRAALDVSVPQIGAPAAWSAGYDGSGTTVAVLDTGYDAAHPDLRGKVTEAANFTPSPDTGDRFGHGTHVAATIAGDGARRGVAPGADLIIGKVLDDDGVGYESWILAGMEWAAAAGAKIVNLSLGGGPTDGTDPLSQGLNEISERTSTLFVVAGGNDGELGANTIGTPGSADQALTVGAVDDDEALASFSSRGPRLGDQAVKPDITAPGVNIVAARAAGTSMGRPVDDLLTEASGTSMATPHVAGAAAILAQRNPQWTGQQLKDALVSTARATDDHTVFEQGAGRVDVPASLDSGVYATGTLNIGPVHGTAVVRKEISYTNTTTEPVTLDLAVDVPSAGTGVRLEQSTVDVQPGATAAVGIVGDAAVLRSGTYGGTVTATVTDSATGVAVHTSVGVVKEAPRHRVTFAAVDANGDPAFASPILLYGEDSRFDVMTWVPPGHTWETEVGAGTYYLNGVVQGDPADPEGSAYQVVDPNVLITGDTTITLDARKATEVVIQTPKPADQQSIFSFYAHRELGERSISNYVMKFAGTRRLLVTPTANVTEGSFEFGSRWSLTAPVLTASTLVFDVPIEPSYVYYSPKFDGRRFLRVVPVGAGTPEDYRRTDVRGAIALVSASSADFDPFAVSAAAAAAGAAMVMVSVPEWSATALEPEPELPIVTLALPVDQGERLARLAGQWPVIVSLTGVTDSPYLYDVMHVERDRVPERVVYRVSDRNSATVTTGYHEMGGDYQLKEQRFGWRPWQDTSINQYQRVVGSPKVREETVTAGDTIWQHRVKHFVSWESMNPLAGGMTQAPTRYQPGQRVRDDWYAPVIRPGIPRGVPGLESVRDGDTLRVRIPEFSDGTHYGFAEVEVDVDPDVALARLYRDGRLLAEAPDGWRDFPVPAEPGSYRLDFSAVRTGADWQFATHADTSWTFRSERGVESLPLLQVDYRVPTDLANLLPAGRKATIELSARHQTGPARADLRAWVSYDDGVTWRETRVDRRGKAVVDHPRRDRTNGFVALRVSAEDAAGNAVTQTVLRAYGLR